MRGILARSETNPLTLRPSAPSGPVNRRAMQVKPNVKASACDRGLWQGNRQVYERKSDAGITEGMEFVSTNRCCGCRDCDRCDASRHPDANRRCGRNRRCI